MKRIMILGGSILQLPAIIKAKEMGLQTIVADMDKHAIGFDYADICLEISTVDIPKVVEAARRHNINGIMTLASDMPMRTVAAVARELNIAGVSEETALKATNKRAMRECLRSHDIPIPAFFPVNSQKEYLDAIRRLGNRFIVKPADNSGSRGVFLVKDIEDNASVNYAYEYSKGFTRCGEIVVEDYMEGPEVSVETLSIDGSVYIVAVTDKLTTGAPRFVEMGHSQPARFPGAIIEQIKAVTMAAVKAIGIRNGPSHTEIIVTPQGPKIVELGARLGGDNITTHLVPLSTGIDMVRCSIEIAMGNRPDFTSRHSMGAAIRYFSTAAGRISCIHGVREAEKLPGVKQISFVKNVGDTVGEIKGSSDRIGFVIAQGRNADESVAICERALKLIEIGMENESIESLDRIGRRAAAYGWQEYQTEKNGESGGLHI